MDNHHYQLLCENFTRVVPFALDELRAAQPYFRFKTYEPNAYLFSAGDVVRDVHFLLEGIGRYFYIDKEGRERNKSLVRKGGAFSSVSSLVDGQPSPFFTQALTECTVGSIEYSRLIELSETHRHWSEFLRRIFERLVIKKETREAGFLLLSARERYEAFLAEFGEDCGRISLRQIAMYLGVTDVTLSRIRKEMGLT